MRKAGIVFGRYGMINGGTKNKTLCVLKDGLKPSMKLVELLEFNDFQVKSFRSGPG